MQVQPHPAAQALLQISFLLPAQVLDASEHPSPWLPPLILSSIFLLTRCAACAAGLCFVFFKKIALRDYVCRSQLTYTGTLLRVESLEPMGPSFTLANVRRQGEYHIAPSPFQACFSFALALFRLSSVESRC